MDAISNHVQNAIMRQALDTLYQLDRGRYGYAIIWPLSIQFAQTARRTIDDIMLYGVDNDGNINRPDNTDKEADHVQR